MICGNNAALLTNYRVLVNFAAEGAICTHSLDFFTEKHRIPPSFVVIITECAADF